MLVFVEVYLERSVQNCSEENDTVAFTTAPTCYMIGHMIGLIDGQRRLHPWYLRFVSFPISSNPPSTAP